MLGHQAALPGLETEISNAEAGDGERIAALLAAQRPLAPPGTRLWYHALTFGWLCGELVRRVDGRTLGRFLADEVAGPLGLDLWIGLPPALEPRVARLEREPRFGTPRRGGRRAAPRTPSRGRSGPTRRASATASCRPTRQPGIRPRSPPRTGSRRRARSPRLYGCLARGGELDGVRLPQPETIALARRCRNRGEEPFLRAPMAFGAGFQLQTAQRQLGPPQDAFGHGGTGGSAHGAWPSLRTGFSYAMNQLRDVGDGDPRPTALLTALHAAVSGGRAAPPAA